MQISIENRGSVLCYHQGILGFAVLPHRQPAQWRYDLERKPS